MRDIVLTRFFRRLRNHLGGVELPTLMMIFVVGVGLWGFIAVADNVSEGDTHRIDRTILLSMRNADDVNDPLGPRWLEEMSRDATAMGGIAILVLLTLSTCTYLWLMGRTRAAWFVLGAIAGGIVLSMLMKMGFDRPRPELVPHESEVYSASFPSGHSMMAAVVYLTLGALLARIHSRRRVKIFFLALAIFVTVAVGVSRVYVGVHWPTDVLAGWAAGATWATLCWLAALWFQHRDEVPEAVDAHAEESDAGRLE